MAVILLFQDTVPLAYPHSTATAAKVVSTLGTSYAKDSVFNRSLQIVDKADGVAGSSSTHSFMRQSDGTVTEIARNVISVDAGVTKGVYSVGCLRYANGTNTIDNVLEASHESLIVTSTSTLDAAQESTTSINYTGVQFSTDYACMYFGGGQNFRIRFGLAEAPGMGNTLNIEAKALDGSYQICQSYTDVKG
jgi:ABC-type histidine transport system ATPase subunit